MKPGSTTQKTYCSKKKHTATPSSVAGQKLHSQLLLLGQAHLRHSISCITASKPPSHLGFKPCQCPLSFSLLASLVRFQGQIRCFRRFLVPCKLASARLAAAVHVLCPTTRAAIANRVGHTPAFQATVGRFISVFFGRAGTSMSSSPLGP